MWKKGASSQGFKSGLSKYTLSLVNECSTKSGKVEAALNHSLYALAAIIAVKIPGPPLGLHEQQRMIRGLIQYHPRLTPVNLSALQQLRRHLPEPLEVESIDKSQLMHTLMSFGELSLVQSGLDFITGVAGGPLPVSTIMGLVRFAQNRHSPALCVLLWRYMQHHYLLSIQEYGTVLNDLMRMFANSTKHSALAEEVARACIDNSANQNVALGIAKVSYKLKDTQLDSDLRNSKGFVGSRSTDAAKLLLEVATNAKRPPAAQQLESLGLTEQEMTSLIKEVGLLDLNEAETLMGEVPKFTTKKQNATVLVALCNQYIHEKSAKKFNETLKTIEHDSPGLNGIRLNLKLKWEQHHGSFKHAKRHYQNWPDIPMKQRRIALITMQTMAKKHYEIEWVAAENRRLARCT